MIACGEILFSIILLEEQATSSREYFGTQFQPFHVLLLCLLVRPVRQCFSIYVFSIGKTVDLTFKDPLLTKLIYLTNNIPSMPMP